MFGNMGTIKISDGKNVLFPPIDAKSHCPCLERRLANFAVVALPSDPVQASRDLVKHCTCIFAKRIAMCWACTAGKL